MRPALAILIAALVYTVTHAGEFPFRFADNLLWVQVRIEGSPRPLTFLLDTGATVSVLDAKTCQEVRLRKGALVPVAGVGASVAGFWPTICQAKAGEVTLPKKFLVLSLADLSSACGCRVDGLIGADFVMEHTIEIDFQQQRVRVDPPGRMNTSDEIILPLKKGPKGALLTEVKVGGVPGWVRLDTGFTGAIDWVADRSRFPGGPTRISVGLTEIATPTTKMDLALGPLSLSDIPTGLHRRAIFPGEAGLLGTEALRRFTVRIALAHSSVHLRSIENALR